MSPSLIGSAVGDNKTTLGHLKLVDQQLASTHDKPTEELTKMLIDDPIKVIQNGDNKEAVEYTKLINKQQQQLSTLPNSTSTSEQLVAKSSSSRDPTAIGKIGEITLKGDPRSIGINPKTNLIYASQSLDLPPYTVITVIDGKTNSVVKNITRPETNSISINENTNTIYITGSGNSTASIIDGKTNS